MNLSPKNQAKFGGMYVMHPCFINPKGGSGVEPGDEEPASKCRT